MEGQKNETKKLFDIKNIVTFHQYNSNQITGIARLSP